MDHPWSQLPFLLAVFAFTKGSAFAKPVRACAAGILAAEHCQHERKRQAEPAGQRAKILRSVKPGEY